MIFRCRSPGPAAFVQLEDDSLFGAGVGRDRDGHLLWLLHRLPHGQGRRRALHHFGPTADQLALQALHFDRLARTQFL